MGRYRKEPRPSQETRDEAIRIARGTQRPGQTKEQTRLIAQGIQKGIDHYKRQQKAKARELDKQRNKLVRERTRKETSVQQDAFDSRYQHHWLPWLLLMITWIAIAIYIFL